MKKGVLLVNLGTPRSPRVRDVFNYLNEFLTDGRVIDFSWIKRQLLVRGIIVPARVRASAAGYSELWTDQGSPLMIHGREVERLLQERLGPQYQVVLAMRYQELPIREGLERLKAAGCTEITVLPLFPHYASATTGSVHQEVMKVVSEWEVIPTLRLINSYPTQPEMINAFVAKGLEHDPLDYDHVLFSFHGLPERHIRKADPTGHCLSGGCCSAEQRNPFCYKAQCVATAHAIAYRLGLPLDNFSICFQSRLGKDPWLQPFTSDLLEALTQPKGQRVLVFCPAFVCDCLETTVEIGSEYAEEFLAGGGGELTLVEGLNSHPLWIDALEALVSGSVSKTQAAPLCH